MDQREIAGFSAQAGSWWDPAGPFAPLHRLNPARMRILSEMMAAHFGRSLDDNTPFQGLSLTDVGCGGGLVTEPCRRIGFSVTGLDASEENIRTARAHALQSDLMIDYKVGAPERDLPANEKANAVLALEVIEHVADTDVFVASLAEHLASDGLLIMSTINRTLKSMALAKFAAEYVLRWVPRGTHDWSKFVRPSELSQWLRDAGLQVIDLRGLAFDLATGDWRETPDVSVNYILAATPA